MRDLLDFSVTLFDVLLEAGDTIVGKLKLVLKCDDTIFAILKGATDFVGMLLFSTKLLFELFNR